MRGLYPPFPGELRSSWLRRLAYANDGNFQSFCNRLYGRNRLWLLDIDCLVDRDLEDALVARTVATREQVRQTSLLSLEGNLVGTIRTGGRGRFILPSNPLLTNPDNPGVQWCPLCLDEKEAYWRKNWRLSFVTICAKHSCRLADRCSDCGACARPIRRGDLKCWRCEYDARLHPLQSPEPGVTELQENLLSHLKDKNADSSEKELKFSESHNVLTFRVLWLLMRLVSISRKSNAVREAIRVLSHDRKPYQIYLCNSWRVEALGINARHSIMALVDFFVRDWPVSFVHICKAANLSWSDMLRGTDERDVPYRYRELLLQSLSPPTYRRSPTFSARYT